MKPATREWVRCAEEDFDVASALMRRRTRTAGNSIGFHCQQCVEKYLKARLNDYAVKFRYPGHVTTRAEARRGLKACQSLRAEVRLSLGLPRK